MKKLIITALGVTALISLGACNNTPAEEAAAVPA